MKKGDENRDDKNVMEILVEKMSVLNGLDEEILSLTKDPNTELRALREIITEQ